MIVIAKQRSPKRAKAKELWLASGGKHTSKELADLLQTSDSTIRKWKKIDEWDKLLKMQNKRKRGGQPGNKNARGAGAPKHNQNAVKHGVYSRIYFGDCSEDEKELIENLTSDVYMNLFLEYQALIIKEKRLREQISELKCDHDNDLHTDTVTEIIKPNKKNKSELEIENGYCIEDSEITVVNERNKNETLEKKIIRKSTSYERQIRLEALLINLHGRITKVLDSMKGYDIESKRLAAEEKRYELALMKAKGEYVIEIDDNI